MCDKIYPLEHTQPLGPRKTNIHPLLLSRPSIPRSKLEIKSSEMPGEQMRENAD